MRLYFLLFLCSFTLVFQGCKKPEAKQEIVAEWNGVQISADEFAQEYRQYVSTSPTKDDLEARKQYALQMLERKIIAERGRKAGLDKLPDVKAQITRQRNLALRRHYLTSAIENTIAQPSEADVREAFRRSRTSLKLQQIFAPNQSEADSLYALLQKGASFDLLATNSMKKHGVSDPENAAKMEGVTWNDMDIEPENAVFALGRGAYSKPVSSLQGWHIFKVIDIEETTPFDPTLYQSAKEKIQSTLHQRQFDEASMQHLRTLLTSQKLMIDMRILNALWTEIAPLIPKGNDVFVVAQMNKDVTLLHPKQVQTNQAVAFVNGKPFTVRQFLAGLPDVPRSNWTSNLRLALETTVRDSILTAKAIEAHADTARSVALETKSAENTALFYTSLRAAADTTNYQRRASWFYNQVKDQQFVKSRTTTARFFTFADSASAWKVIRLQSSTRDWASALEQAGVKATESEEKITGDVLKDIPIQTLPISPADKRQLAGPFPYKNKWIMIEVLNRDVQYKPFEDVQNELPALMRQQVRLLVERSLLPAEYRPEWASIYEEALQKVLPLP
jgi:parvulin-like peptidyl-prolyl isomerase